MAGAEHCNRAIARSSDESELLTRVCQTIVKAGRYRLAWVGYAQADSVIPVAHAGHSGIPDHKPA